jgi:hypothetical protein
MAAKRFSGRDSVVVRGYSGMDSSELFGHMTLTSDRSSDVGGVVELINKRTKELEKLNPGASEADKKDLAKSILSQSGVTVSEYILGAVYKCAAEGRVLILDEANYIPPTLLAKLNDILTKRPGERINVQEDGVEPIVVKEGWGIILTGNINHNQKDKRYLGRHEFDLAFRDRIKTIEYNYLPQATDGKPTDHLPENKQLFQVAVAALLAPYRPILRAKTSDGFDKPEILESIENRHGSMYLPGGAEGLDVLWRLCQFASVTQRAFAGEVKDNSPYGFTRGGVSTGYRPDIALSPRVLRGVLEDWRADGFRYNVDHYLGKALLERAFSTEDQSYFFQLGKMFGFFGTTEWQGVDQALSNHKKLALPAMLESKKSPEFVPGAVVLEALFTEIPKRTVWPDGANQEIEIDKDNAAALLALQLRFQGLDEAAAKAVETFAFLADGQPADAEQQS